jgi:DinB superfamily
MGTSIQYPIGKFIYPDHIEENEVSQWIEDVELLPSKLSSVVKSLTEEQLDLSYKDKGWTVRQLVHHLADSHTNGYIRFHWALTEITPTIKPYNQNAWASLDYLKEICIDVSLNMLVAIHCRWATMMKTITDSDLERAYIHPEEERSISLKQAIALYAWHGNHHLAHIKLVKEKYCFE